jgi:hypothetical protein
MSGSRKNSFRGPRAERVNHIVRVNLRSGRVTPFRRVLLAAADRNPKLDWLRKYEAEIAREQKKSPYGASGE